MTTPLIVVYAAQSAFRTVCVALLRAAGARVRVASRQAELAKAVAEGIIAVIIAGDEPSDVAAVHALAASVTAAVPVMQRAPGESIEGIVARALAVAAVSADQPRSSE